MTNFPPITPRDYARGKERQSRRLVSIRWIPYYVLRPTAIESSSSLNDIRSRISSLRAEARGRNLESSFESAVECGFRFVPDLCSKLSH